MTTDVRLTSGLTRTFFYFFYGGSPFFLKKIEKKNFSENRATRRPWRHSICLPYTAGGMHSQNKHDRHTDSRFSLFEDNSPRDGRDHKTKTARDEGVEKHSCQIELIGVHVKLV
jgi:hypothetical protein